jgi:hypothetical protein
LWVLTALILGSSTFVRRRRVLAGLLLASLALPSTVEFAWQKASLRPIGVPAGVLRAMSALKAASPPGAVVLERPLLLRMPPPPVVFVGRRVPYSAYVPFLSQWAAKAELAVREKQVQRFFQTRDAAEALEIARSVGASFVCLYGSDEVGFEAAWLRPLYEDPWARVYAIDYFTKR